MKPNKPICTDESKKGLFVNYALMMGIVILLKNDYLKQKKEVLKIKHKPNIKNNYRGC